jgi:hypothetical protein
MLSYSQASTDPNLFGPWFEPPNPTFQPAKHWLRLSFFVSNRKLLLSYDLIAISSRAS